MPFHDPYNPRHGRIFELLRANDVSIDHAVMAKQIKNRQLDGAEIEAVKSAAIQSFKGTDKIKR